MDQLTIRKDTYFDSVFLMAVSAELAGLAGLQAGHVVLATPANLRLLADQGFTGDALEGLTPTDLIIALRADAAETLEAAAARVEQLLTARGGAAGGGPGEDAERAVGLDGGLAQLPDASLALISVPGAYAAFEARKALDAGLNVMIFSDHVSLEDEVTLKTRGDELGLLVMGPDCGTALIDGRPLGFANRVRRGAVGLVGASGTGLQEVACQIHRLGGGVTHMIGTGGRDLKAEVGGRTTLAALKLLAADPQTKVLVVISKPPAEAVAQAVIDRLRRLDKPSVVCFLGQEAPEQGLGAKVQQVETLREAAWLAHCLAAGQSIATTQPYDSLGQDVSRWVSPMSPEQCYLHGLFTGGTLGGEALLVLRRELEGIRSNLDPEGLEQVPAQGHSLLDLGDDAYTQGRPHPMIDPSVRCEMIEELGARPTTAALLLDLVLGTGSHPDPAGPAADAVARARKHNPGLAVITSITGTTLDPQDLKGQQERLREVGVQVMPSNVAAAALAARIVHAAAGQ